MLADQRHRALEKEVVLRDQRGGSARGTEPLIPPRLSSLGGCDDHGHLLALHARRTLDLHRLSEFSDDAIEDLGGAFSMESFAPPKEHGELNLVPFVEEHLGAVQLDLAIVGVGFGPNPDFLQANGMRGRRRLLPLFPVVFVLAVIHDPADGGALHRRYLDEVKPRLARNVEGFISRDNAE